MEPWSRRNGDVRVATAMREEIAGDIDGGLLSALQQVSDGLNLHRERAAAVSLLDRHGTEDHLVCACLDGRGDRLQGWRQWQTGYWPLVTSAVRWRELMRMLA